MLVANVRQFCIVKLQPNVRTWTSARWNTHFS